MNFHLEHKMEPETRNVPSLLEPLALSEVESEEEEESLFGEEPSLLSTAPPSMSLYGTRQAQNQHWNILSFYRRVTLGGNITELYSKLAPHISVCHCMHCVVMTMIIFAKLFIGFNPEFLLLVGGEILTVRQIVNNSLSES